MFRVKGLGFKLGFAVFRVKGLGFKLGFAVFRVKGLGFKLGFAVFRVKGLTKFTACMANAGAQGSNPVSSKTGASSPTQPTPFHTPQLKSTCTHFRTSGVGFRA